jgi:hypothetical protein
MPTGYGRLAAVKLPMRASWSWAVAQHGVSMARSQIEAESQQPHLTPPDDSPEAQQRGQVLAAEVRQRLGDKLMEKDHVNYF